MRFANEGEWDRGVRMLAGALLLYVGWSGLASGSLGVVALVAGGVAVATGIVGWCPAYTAFGISTKKVSVGHCPNCAPDHRA